MTAAVIYKGTLRCSATHLQSGTIIKTDAPTDNKGKGERFSPTDLLCVSLATCIITTIGIKAADLNIDLTNTKMEVTKHMQTEPRRIAQIDVHIFFKATNEISEKDIQILERTGNNCPVAKSLHTDTKVLINYNW